MVIYLSNKIDGRWTKPVVASFSSPGAKWKDIDPVFSPDGKTALFQSNRTIPVVRTGFDIRTVDKTIEG